MQLPLVPLAPSLLHRLRLKDGLWHLQISLWDDKLLFLQDEFVCLLNISKLIVLRKYP